MNETKKTGLGFLGYKDPHNGRDPIGSLYGIYIYIHISYIYIYIIFVYIYIYIIFVYIYIYIIYIYIYLHTYIYIWLMFIVNVGKYTSPMDPVGTITANLIGVVY